MPQEHCPDTGALRRLLLGELSGAEATALAEHFARCERCARLIEELSDEDPLAQALRAQRALPSDPDAAVADALMDRIQRLPLQAASEDPPTVRPGGAPAPRPPALADAGTVDDALKTGPHGDGPDATPVVPG